MNYSGPENYFLSHSFYPTLNGQSFYFDEYDYQQKANKTINIAKISSEQPIGFMQIQNKELYDNGLKKLENLMATGVPQGSKVYLFSSSSTEAETNTEQVETVGNFFMDKGMIKKQYQIIIPSLLMILSSAIQHPYTRLISATGVIFACCMMFELLIGTKRSKVPWLTLLPHFLIQGIASGILEFAFLTASKYGAVSLQYSLDTMLFIWGGSASLGLIFAPLALIVFTLSFDKREKLLSMIKGIMLGSAIVADSILFSSLIHSLVDGYRPDTLFILCCLILPLLASYYFVYKIVFNKSENESFAEKDRVQTIACSLILIVLAGLIGMAFVPWTAALIAALMLIPIFRTDLKKYIKLR